MPPGRCLKINVLYRLRLHALSAGKIKEGRKERKKEERKGQKDQLAACILAGVHVICTRLSKHCCQSDGPSFHS